VKTYEMCVYSAMCAQYWQQMEANMLAKIPLDFIHEESLTGTACLGGWMDSNSLEGT